MNICRKQKKYSICESIFMNLCLNRNIINIACFNTYFHCLINQKPIKLNKAIQFFKNKMIKKYNIAPTIITYTTLLKGCKLFSKRNPNGLNIAMDIWNNYVLKHSNHYVKALQIDKQCYHEMIQIYRIFNKTTQANKLSIQCNKLNKCNKKHSKRY